MIVRLGSSDGRVEREERNTMPATVQKASGSEPFSYGLRDWMV
jgi:hypothetical protein